jgi:hypothetical protein
VPLRGGSKCCIVTCVASRAFKNATRIVLCAGDLARAPVSRLPVRCGHETFQESSSERIDPAYVPSLQSEPDASAGVSGVAVGTQSIAFFRPVLKVSFLIVVFPVTLEVGGLGSVVVLAVRVSMQDMVSRLTMQASQRDPRRGNNIIVKNCKRLCRLEFV